MGSGELSSRIGQRGPAIRAIARCAAQEMVRPSQAPPSHRARCRASPGSRPATSSLDAMSDRFHALNAMGPLVAPERVPGRPRWRRSVAPGSRSDACGRCWWAWGSRRSRSAARPPTAAARGRRWGAAVPGGGAPDFWESGNDLQQPGIGSATRSVARREPVDSPWRSGRAPHARRPSVDRRRAGDRMRRGGVPRSSFGRRRSGHAGRLSAPIAVAGVPDGGFLIVDEVAAEIRRVDAQGIITTVAGGRDTGSYHSDPVGVDGPATQASLVRPDAVAAPPTDGSTSPTAAGSCASTPTASSGPRPTCRDGTSSSSPHRTTTAC